MAGTAQKNRPLAKTCVSGPYLSSYYLRGSPSYGKGRKLKRHRSPFAFFPATRFPFLREGEEIETSDAEIKNLWLGVGSPSYGKGMKLKQAPRVPIVFGELGFPFLREGERLDIYVAIW